ncbi:hypothetical protein C8N46_108133 [Kordia periserrulae]|uniref:Nucleotidyltransferase-like protein n=1 Tax=Kordia periserrulae TaxID=701523 RepID=A0A2T6BUR6_9FLAO|nr:hypothetical protein [Kordia periserrulae]PTX59820.1 hypothetical protein C8N46_108133 [Kordia periserrulae]
MKKDKDNFTTKGAFIGGTLGLLLNYSRQSNELKENPNQEFNFTSFVTYGILGAILGAVSFKIISFLASTFSDEEILDDIDEINYLASVLETYEPDEIDKEVLLKGKIIKAALFQKFGSNLLGRPSYQGSKVQKTELSGLSDLDILCKFKRTSFQREGNMYRSVYNFLKSHFYDRDLVGVREQGVSLGLIYDINGYEEIIDVVPALRTDFEKGKNEYNLYKNPKFSKGERKLKMNPKVQKDLGNNEREKTAIIKLLKLLRSEEKLPLKSVLITEFTKRAFQELEMPKELNLQLYWVIEYIRDNILTIKINSPDNENSSLTDRLSYSQKKKIRNSLSKILNDLEEDRNNLLKYFPEK